MTATVTPALNAHVKRADPKLRLDDYERAFRYWLSYAHPAVNHILLLENSNADLSSFERIAASENTRGKEIELLSVPENFIPHGSNYGYAEMQLLDAGLQLSRLRRETTHMIKTTGRLVFPEIGPALDHIKLPLQMLIDFRKLGFPRRGFDTNTQIFVTSHAFYDRVLRGSQKEMNSRDIRLLEHLFAHKIFPLRSEPGVYLRFPINVDPVGISGFSSRPYDSPRLRLTRRIRSLLRRIAPDFWF